jgi:hypothetical protein
MEIIWEKRVSRSQYGSEHRLVVDGESTTYIIVPWHGESGQISITIFMGGVVVSKSKMNIDDAKKWCERDYKLRLLTFNS